MVEKDIVTIGVGGIHIVQAPKKIVTYLGSCIAVCLYAPKQKIGGMVHIAMAVAPATKNNVEIQKGKYADTAVRELLDQLKAKYDLGVEEFVVKIFGGAKILKTVNVNIGNTNEQAVRDILKKFGMKIVASQTGGEKGYHIKFNLESGKIVCRLFGEEPKEY